MWRTAFAGVFSLTQGALDGFAAGYSILKNTSKSFLYFSGAGISFAVGTIATWFFQGEAIRHPDEATKMQIENVETPKDTAETAPPKKTESSKETDQLISTNKSTTKRSCSSYSAIKFASCAAQFGYMTIDTGTSFINRYYLFYIIFKVFESDPTSTLFRTILTSDMLVYKGNDFTNETYAVTTKIAEKIEGEGAKPFYGKLFLPIAKSDAATKVFKIITCAEHTLMEHILPFCGFLSPEALDYLKRHPFIAVSIYTVSTVIGLPLAIIFFGLAYLFEGANTEKHLKEIAGKVASTTKPWIPEKAVEWINRALNLSAVADGASAAALFYYGVHDLIENPLYKWPVSITGAFLVFIVKSIGIYLSEVHEAKKTIEKMTSSPSPSPTNA